MLVHRLWDRDTWGVRLVSEEGSLNDISAETRTRRSQPRKDPSRGKTASDRTASAQELTWERALGSWAQKESWRVSIVGHDMEEW